MTAAKEMIQSPMVNDKTRDSDGLKNGTRSAESNATFRLAEKFDKDMSLSPFDGRTLGQMPRSETQLNILQAQVTDSPDQRIYEKLQIDLSEIKVDEHDLTPVDLSENVICSQDLA